MRDDPYLDWLIKNLEVKGRSQSGLARHLGIDPSSVNRIVRGRRKLQTHEIPLAAEYFGVAAPPVEIVPTSTPLKMAPVVGTVKAGEWREADDIDDADGMVQIAVTVDERFPNARLMLFDVEGDSMNALQPRGIYPGDRVACVAYEDVAHSIPLRDGMVVVVQRTRDGGHLREWSIKQLEIYDDRHEFHPRSTNPKHKPIIIPRNLQADDGTTVEVIAVVRRITNEVPFL